MVYILSEARLKNDFNDVINLQSSPIQEATRNAQDIYLRSIIGDYLLDTLEEMIENNMLTGDYKILVDEYCIPYLEFRTMAELQMSTFKLNNAGANQVYDSNINTLTLEQVKYLEQQYINKASYYENRMTKYLIQSGIPEYKMNTGITNASTTITEQTGIFLGGTSRTTKTTKRTSTTNNNVGAVRYDTYQKLTDAEKQQARENIGMYNYNDDAQFDSNKYYNKSEINNRFNDYYNKEEVDTLVDSVETFSGNYNDLTNKPDIYTTEQVDTLIENINIPTKTSDLTLDNVYDKTQVDSLISDVPTFSGNYEDLSNKPSIYTKEETDTLISNINTFDGDYNSLTNKPDVYTKSQTYNKEEIDDLVANSGSGGTTDLSNYYTKSETYSKSEIDLQIAEINTTLGSINNILNTI